MAKKPKEERVKQGYSDEDGLCFGRIFSVVVKGDKCTFTEECDGYYEEEMTREEAIGVLETFIEYIRS